jgi:hypothetical protein
MLCFLCGKKIGLLRSLFDQQYCCPEHRKEARLASAQALRDEEDFEPWAVAKSRDKKIGPKNSQAGQTASIFAFLTVGLLLIAALLLPGPSNGGQAGRPQVSLNPTVTRGFFARTTDSIAEWVRSSSPITLHHDFSIAGLSDWTNVALSSTIDDPKDWGTSATRPKLASAGTLRLWNKSTLLENYQMEFQGQIDHKSLSWAFRATDAANYYATKVTITRPGPLPNASLVRYVVMNGREWDRVQLPLPITLDRGQSYRVRVSVQDDRFITYLDGRVISSWTDKRLHRGGVGFFSEPEDPQEVAWVNVSERDSLLGRILAQFSLFRLPAIE